MESGYLNDLWMFNATSGMWTWISGSNTINDNGFYGTKKSEASSNVPGARTGHAMAWDASRQRLYLFAGQNNMCMSFSK